MRRTHFRDNYLRFQWHSLIVDSVSTSLRQLGAESVGAAARAMVDQVHAGLFFVRSPVPRFVGEDGN